MLTSNYIDFIHYYSSNYRTTKPYRSAVVLLVFRLFCFLEPAVLSKFMTSKRKQILLKHFGSAKGVSRAGIDDLLEVDGINEATAQVIYGFFNGG